MSKGVVYRELEDAFGDVVGKARRGQEISIKEISGDLDISIDNWRKLERYEWFPDKETIGSIASYLGLHPGKLRDSAEYKFFPEDPIGSCVVGHKLDMIVLSESSFEGSDGMTMNSYLVTCPTTNQAAFIDPGFDESIIFETIEKRCAQLKMVLLTHGHYDHIGAVSRLVKETGADVFISRFDAPLLGDDLSFVTGYFEPDERISCGDIVLRAVSTGGHTPGGTSFIGDGYAFVGDALFAGSLGGTRHRQSFYCQRSAVDKEILSLKPSTIILPGHGPATTVQEERANNPYFFFM